MPLVYYVPEYERDASQTPLDAERLLRLLGAMRSTWWSKFGISRRI